MINDFVIESVIDDLNFFDKFQSKTVSLDDVIEIKNKQQSILDDSFTTGFKELSSVCESNESFNISFIGFFIKVFQGFYLDNAKEFAQEQEALYSLLHQNKKFSFKDKVFYEYSIGLLRFVITIQLLYHYLGYLYKNDMPKELKGYYCKVFIQEQTISIDSFFEKMAEISDFGKTLISCLSDFYFKNDVFSLKYWSDIEEYFSNHINLDLLARALVSIQYVPENKRYLAIMQSIHWQGLGGSGDVLNKFSQLSYLKHHAISHHDNYNTGNSFNKRLLAFKFPLENILFKVQNIVNEYIASHLLEDTIDIYDFCSGPRFNAVNNIIKQNKFKNFKLTVSDVDGTSLLALLDEHEKSKYENIKKYEVRYDDLCLPLKASSELINKYDLVTVNLGLHQIPHEEIYASLKHFGRITKIGGLIVNLDASEKRYFQLMIIPGNLVDREGYVPNIDQMDITQLTLTSNDDNHVKIIYPLINLSKKAVKGLDPNIGEGPYMVSFYTPILVEKNKLNLLYNLWARKKYKECDQLVFNPFKNLE